MPYKKEVSINAEGYITIVALYKENGDEFAPCGECTITPEEFGSDFVEFDDEKKKRKIKSIVNDVFNCLKESNEAQLAPPPPTKEEMAVAVTGACDSGLLEELNNE